MWTVVLAGVRRRLAALGAIFIATMLGAGLLVTSGALFETGIRLAAPPERLTAAPIVVIGDPSYRMLNADGEPTADLRPYPERHRLDPSAATTIGRVDGVAAAVPVFLISTGGPTGAPVVGQNWASARLGPFPLIGGNQPTGDREVAVSVDLGVSPGDDITLAPNGVPTPYRVSGTVGGPETPTTIFFSEREARRLSGNDRPDAIGVIPGDRINGATVEQHIEDAVTGVRLLTDDGRGAAEHANISAARTSTIVMGAVFAGIVMVVLGVVVSAVIGLSVQQRSREVSLLRAVGATGRQARRLIVRETALVGAVGTLTGLVLGIPLAQIFFAAVRGADAVPPALQLRHGPIPVLAGGVATMVVVWVAARVASRSARRARAIDALRDADIPRYRLGPVRWILGVVVGLGAIALGIITSLMSPALVTATSGPAALAGSISVALLAPALLRLGTFMARPFAKVLGGSTGLLAVHNTRARAGQLAGIAACVALVLGIGAGNLATQSIQDAGMREASVAGLRADTVLTAPTGLSPATVDDVRALEEVQAASAFVRSGGWIESPYDSSHRDRPWSVHGVSASGAGEVFRHRVVAGSLMDLRGDAIALPEVTARTLAVAVGDAITFRFGDGAREPLRVVAVYEDLAGYENLLLPADLVASHTTTRTVPQVLAVGDGAGDAIVAAFAGLEGASVGSRAVIEDSMSDGADVQAVINSVLVLIAIAYAAIAVVNTVTVSILGRRRELALLRLAGATRQQVRRLVQQELLIVAATGVVAGLVVATAAIVPASIAVTQGNASRAVVVILAGLLGVVVLLVVPATYAVTRHALGRRPSEAVASAG